MVPFLFVPFGSTAPDAAVSCDGLVEGTSLHASHWAGNRTPPDIKADTSTEIALRLVQRGLPKGAQAANNHFDADGALAVFALLEPEIATKHAALITAAAEAGDFDEWPSEDRGLRLEIAVRAMARRTLAGGDERAYAETLPRIAALVADLDAHRALWEGEWQHLLDTDKDPPLDVFHHERIDVFVHRPGAAEAPGPVLSRRASSDATRWLIAFDRGGGAWDYRYERRRWAWADTVTRPRIDSPSRHRVLRGLGSDAWLLKGDLGMTGITRTRAPIRARPDEVAAALARNDPA